MGLSWRWVSWSSHLVALGGEVLEAARTEACYGAAALARGAALEEKRVAAQARYRAVRGWSARACRYFSRSQVL